MAGLLAGLAWLLAPAGASAVPYNQCPAIGYANSCNVLITIDQNGTVSIAVDSNVGPYDGSEDMLVGVENLWNQAVGSLTLSGSNIFGFDGDGAGSPGCDLGTNSPNGCPYNLQPTGYEGLVAGDPTRLVTFNVVDNNNGDVVFAGGLAPNETAWFSLETPPSAASGIGGRVNPPSVPEPASLALLGLGLAGLARRLRRETA